MSWVSVLVDSADKEFSLLLTEHVCAKKKMPILMHFGHPVWIQKTNCNYRYSKSTKGNSLFLNKFSWYSKEYSLLLPGHVQLMCQGENAHN